MEIDYFPVINILGETIYFFSKHDFRDQTRKRFVPTLYSCCYLFQGVRNYDPNICELNAVKISIYVIDSDSQLVDNDRNNEGAKDTLFHGA